MKRPGRRPVAWFPGNSTKGPTPRQAEVLRFIARFIAGHELELQRAPQRREVLALEHKGMLTTKGIPWGRGRGYRIPFGVMAPGITLTPAGCAWLEQQRQSAEQRHQPELVSESVSTVEG